MGNPITDVLNKKVKRPNEAKYTGMSRKNVINNLHPELQKEIDDLDKKKNDNEKDISVIDKFKGPDADTQILYYKRRKMEIRNNLLFNFNFIMQVLDNILRRAFKSNPPVYNDYFKNKHLYNLMVFSPEMNRKRQLVTSSENDDDIEFMNGMYTPSEDCELFLRDNQRWMHMYELSTIELCGDLATKIMEDEAPKIVKGFNLNNNKYAINKPGKVRLSLSKKDENLIENEGDKIEEDKKTEKSKSNKGESNKEEEKKDKNEESKKEESDDEEEEEEEEEKK
jgi:hypothetical protein